MGRGKVVLRRIDDKTVRKVTFSKRRQGFFKKAGELSVLCGAEVAALVFSSTRRSYSFSHPGSVEVIIKRYHEHKLAKGHSTEDVRSHQLEDRCVGAVNNLQTTIGFFTDLSYIEDLNLIELVQLELQLYEILKEIIDWKNLMIVKSNDLLQEKVQISFRNSQRETLHKRGNDP